MKVDLQETESQALQQWESSPQLRAEFANDRAAYLALRRAEASGLCRIFGGAVARGDATKSSQARRFKLDAPFTLNPAARCTFSAATRGHVKGYAAVFGTTNRKQGRILPGAFRNAVNRVPLTMLWQHDQDTPIGRWDVLREDQFGLLAEGQINLNVTAGRDAFELLRHRDVTGLSVGFNAEPGGYSEIDGVNVFNEVDLLEISIASVPAEDAARMFEVKGA
jgi:HK97 family phage prohead protease